MNGIVDLPKPNSWWQASDALPRFLADLIASERQRLRPGAQAMAIPSPFAPATELGEGGLGFDSLERLEIATTLSEALHLAESGVEDYLLAPSTFGDWCAIAAVALSRFSARLSFRTSGSTGQPKPVVHALAELEREVEALKTLLPQNRVRVLSAVPCHHIYGFLFTVLLPQSLGGVPAIDLRRHSPGALASIVRQGDLVVGHPVFWGAVARSGAWRWPPSVAGVSSGAPCPAATARAVTAAGLETFLEVHGSTETAGLGYRFEPEAPFTLLPHWRRDGAEHIRRERGSGEPDGMAEAPVLPPDRLEWLDQRRYQLAGRRDFALQVGGVNVFPERVRQCLCRHPDVAEAAVRLMNPAEGARLKAFIVPRDPAMDPGALRRALDLHVERELAAPERPRAFAFGPALPTDPAGKAADWPALENRETRPG